MTTSMVCLVVIPVTESTVVGYVVEYVLGYVLPEGPWEVVEVELVGVCAYALSGFAEQVGPSVVEI